MFARTKKVSHACCCKVSSSAVKPKMQKTPIPANDSNGEQ